MHIPDPIPLLATLLTPVLSFLTPLSHALPLLTLGLGLLVGLFFRRPARKPAPAPILTCLSTNTRSLITPLHLIDTSPPLEYGSLAPGRGIPDHHELMYAKERDKAVAQSKVRWDE
jgi:hypothetical protein